MALRFTRQQRINNVAASMVEGYPNVAKSYRDLLTKGLDLPADEKYPALKATGDEVREALGDNAKIIETVNAYILDGKSNDITRAVKAQRPARKKK